MGTPSQHDRPANRHARYDVIVVGAGVVGCAVARNLALEGAKILVVDKAGDILDGASKGNSAILHTGFDAQPGSLEQACIADGYQEFMAIHERLGLPIQKSGALVLAWSKTEVNRLQSIAAQAIRNGVDDTRILPPQEVLAMEPGIRPDVLAALHVPGESLVDPWSTPLAYLQQAKALGADLLLDCEIVGGRFDDDLWRLSSRRGELRGRWVVNCAGLFGDRLNMALFGESDFEIRPRKGQFLVYDKSASQLTRSILLPVPSPTTKGIVVCPTVFGNLLVGPTAEEQESRDSAAVNQSMLQTLQATGEAILPALGQHAITATYAGIRPATREKDYQVALTATRNYLCLGGIRSTGLSAALGIAKLACSQICDKAGKFKKPNPVPWPEVPQISEVGERDWQRPGNGGIVCHCELVTRREIQQALHGPIPVNTLAGLKRRTRVTMGRCQGFYCSAELSEITAGYIDPPLDTPAAEKP